MGSTGREVTAATSALGAYLTTVLPRARRELRRLGPLPAAKARNVEAVALFAILAPRSRRAAVVRAIVALQVAIDLRDELEEAGEDPSPEASARIEGLEEAWRREVAALPASAAAFAAIERAVGRCKEGQLHTHRAARGNSAALERWAAGLDAPPGYRWWEVAAGASSSVAAHALIAAAADPATAVEATAAVDAAYYPPIGALTVLLDDLVDRSRDLAANEHNYLAYYLNPDEAAERLALIAGEAAELIERLPRSSRSAAILGGVLAYYLSGPEADSEYARPIKAQLLAALGPGTRLQAAFVRLWRRQEDIRPG